MASMKNLSFYSHSFGCRVNQAEKEEIDRKLAQKGLNYDKANPDLFIINTCAVTLKAEREARQMINHISKSFPKCKIVVTGCAATYWLKKNIGLNLKNSLIISNSSKDKIDEIIFEKLSIGKEIIKPNASLEKGRFIGSGRMIFKIQDGCQRFCSFCIVPYLRGHPKSLKTEEIIGKVNEMSKKHRLSEAILASINTQAFGYDTGEKFVQMVDRLISETNVPRISFGSIHPWSVENDFLRFYQKILNANRLVNFFHIPLQSGSDKILSLMERDYTRQEFVDKLKETNKINPNALIATDIIVGFPGEGDREFDETYRFLDESPIKKFHVFRFSLRPGTKAMYLAKKNVLVTDEKKHIRSQALIKLSRKKMLKFQLSQIGRTSSLLFLEKKENGMNMGLLDNQTIVFVKKTNATPGEIKNIKIIDFKKDRLFGKIV